MEHPWPSSHHNIFTTRRTTSPASSITSDYPSFQTSQMSLIYLYQDPITQFDRLFEDALTARFCSRACAPSTEASHTILRHRDAYSPR